MANSLVQKKPKFSVALQSDAYKNLINNTLQDPKRAQRFVANISSAVATNPVLQECDAGTILSGALLGESLNLSPSPQLGQFYLVPFEDRERGKLAQFILGYKGYIQLAIRSGQYKKLNVIAIKEGELAVYNRLDEVVDITFIDDDEVRESKPTIGYFVMFELVNGFRKTMYWSKKKMEAHAFQYSKGYASDKKKGTSWTFWSKDFDGMAYKTMLRQLISKWGIMSIEMTQAYESDMGVIRENNKVEYVDNDDTILPITANDTNNFANEQGVAKAPTIDVKGFEGSNNNTLDLDLK
jgi:recombination protein RecT